MCLFLVTQTSSRRCITSRRDAARRSWFSIPTNDLVKSSVPLRHTTSTFRATCRRVVSCPMRLRSELTAESFTAQRLGGRHCVVRAYEEMAFEHEERTANHLVGCPLHDSSLWECHSSPYSFDLPCGCAIAFIWRVEHCRCSHFGAKPTLWTHACPTPSQWPHVRSLWLFLVVDVSICV